MTGCVVGRAVGCVGGCMCGCVCGCVCRCVCGCVVRCVGGCVVGCVGGCLIEGNRTEVGSVSFGRVASFDHIFRVWSLGELKKKIYLII